MSVMSDDMDELISPRGQVCFGDELPDLQALQASPTVILRPIVSVFEISEPVAEAIAPTPIVHVELSPQCPCTITACKSLCPKPCSIF
jgi:hypothetical protein